jgi:hypothetical protein
MTVLNDTELSMANAEREKLKQLAENNEEACKEIIEKQAKERLGRRQKRNYWQRLLGHRGSAVDLPLPGDDHPELWRTQDGRLVYVSHPYNLWPERLEEIRMACEQHGLEATLSGISWYNPGGTYRVEYRKRRRH